MSDPQKKDPGALVGATLGPAPGSACHGTGPHPSPEAENAIVENARTTATRANMRHSTPELACSFSAPNSGSQLRPSMCERCPSPTTLALPCTVSAGKLATRARAARLPSPSWRPVPFMDRSRTSGPRSLSKIRALPLVSEEDPPPDGSLLCCPFRTGAPCTYTLGRRAGGTLQRISQFPCRMKRSSGPLRCFSRPDS